MKMGAIVRAVFAVSLFLLCSLEFVWARHKCPKVPAPPGIMGIFSSTTLIPSGSVMAAARSSQTLGCDRGHPSENFYKPQKERVSMFLEDNLHYIREESAQGQGRHLDALALIVGCSTKFSQFGMVIKSGYVEVFDTDSTLHISDSSAAEVERTTERILSLISDSPVLASSCESG